MNKGIFITIEGPDGAGKSSVIEELAPLLEQRLKQTELVVTREPGGIPISEQIRHVILSPENEFMEARTEALLYAASRRQHLCEKIVPALKKGKMVLCDRFVDSSLAYQGEARRIGIDEVAKLNEFATEGLEPDLTLYLDVDSDTGLNRIKNTRGHGMDRLDRESLSFHQRVRHGYLKVVENNPERIILVDASMALQIVVEQCLAHIERRFEDLFI